MAYTQAVILTHGKSLWAESETSEKAVAAGEHCQDFLRAYGRKTL